MKIIQSFYYIDYNYSHNKLNNNSIPKKIKDIICLMYFFFFKKKKIITNKYLDIIKLKVNRVLLLFFFIMKKVG